MPRMTENLPSALLLSTGVYISQRRSCSKARSRAKVTHLAPRLSLVAGAMQAAVAGRGKAHTQAAKNFDRIHSEAKTVSSQALSVGFPASYRAWARLSRVTQVIAWRHFRGECGWVAVPHTGE